MTRGFLRASALCWMISAVTTLGLIFLPYFFPPVSDLESQAKLATQPAYMTRVWIALFHPLIVLVGALGVLALRFRESPGLVSCGFLFFVFWALTEGIQQSLTLVALNWTWRSAYLTANESGRGEIETFVRGFDPISDGLFFFLLIAFIAANLFYCVGSWGGGRLQRTVSVFFALAAGLGAVSLATSFGGDLLPGRVMAILYPSIQPAGRFLTGFWLWTHES